MKTKLFNLLVNPFAIAFILSLAIIYYLPDIFSKYEIVHEKTDYYSASDYLYFSDLDGDSISERIIVHKNSQNKASYLIHNSEDEVIDQYNFNSNFSNKNWFVGFLDVDNDGFKEIYNITHRKDSLFLNVLEPLQSNGYKREILVDILPKYNGEDLSANNEVKTKGFHLQKIKNALPRVAFESVTGFFQYPRNIYAYDFNWDTIYKSKHLANPSSINQVVDFDGDGNDEILIAASSADNQIDSIFTTRSDSSSWLNVLDDNLSFLFTPIEYPVKGSSVIGNVLKIEKEHKFLALFKPRYLNNRPPEFYYYDLRGNLISKKNSIVNWNYTFLEKDNNLHLFDWKKGKYGLFNAWNGEIIKERFVEARTSPNFLDVDQDGTKELVGLHHPNRTLTIYRNDLTDSITVNLPNKFETNKYRLGVFNDNLGSPKIWIQNRSELYTYDYRRNPLYILKYPIYGAIYMMILVLVWLIMKAQSLQEEKKRKIETQIAELQMKTIKNQFDPHFVFNAINTISEMTLTDNKLEADKYITALSSLMRKTLRASDKIAHSLKNELDYIENYVHLQQIRLHHSFNFELEIEETIDTGQLIPKHVLYTYVENAIKHGLALKENQGKLWVRGNKIPKGIQLIVADNGGGIGKSKAKTAHSTGSGLKIMEQIFKLYQERFKKSIALEYTTHKDASGDGLAVQISISS